MAGIGGGRRIRPPPGLEIFFTLNYLEKPLTALKYLEFKPPGWRRGALAGQPLFIRPPVGQTMPKNPLSPRLPPSPKKAMADTLADRLPDGISHRRPDRRFELLGQIRIGW